MPRGTTEAMGLHPTEIAKPVAPGAHAVLLLDQVGCPTARKRAVLDNITLLPLPARSPELNPVKNLWQFIRDKGLGYRVFASDEAILDHRCDARNKLMVQPRRVMSIGRRPWGHAC